MRWVDTPNAGRSGFVHSRLYNGYHWQDGHGPLVEIGYHEGTYYVEFTRFAPAETHGLRNQEFNALDEAKVWAVAMVRLS